MNDERTLEYLIQDEAISLLEECGIYCKNERVKDTLEATGLAAYDPTTERLHILGDLVKSSLQKAPKRHKLGIPDHSFGPGGVAAYVKQGDDYVLPDVDIHTKEIAKLSKEFNLPFIFNSAKHRASPYIEQKQLENIRKYYSGPAYLRMETKQGLEDALEDGNVITTHSPIDSPMKLNTDNDISLLFDSVERGLPIYLTSMPVSCLTGCASMYGIATQSYAEFLAGNTLVQTINPETLVVNGGFPAAGNPSNNYMPALGSMFHNKINMLLNIVSEIYGIPSIQSGCTTSNKVHTPTENGTDYDTEIGFRLWNTYNNWHQVRHTLGFVDNLIALDFDKFRRDCVSLTGVLENNEVYEGEIEKATYDSEAYNAIIKGSELGQFKDIDHTVKNIGIIDEALYKE